MTYTNPNSAAITVTSTALITDKHPFIPPGPWDLILVFLRKKAYVGRERYSHKK